MNNRLLAVLGFLFAFLLSVPAHADDSQPMTLEVPALGVKFVAKAGGCDFTVVGNVPARKAGELATALADAKSRCMVEQARIARLALDQQMAADRSTAQTELVGGLTINAMNGGSVSYTASADGSVHMASGNAAEWSEYGNAVSNGTGIPGAAYDPRFVQPYVLDQGRAAFMAHPAVPGAQPVASNADTASCGTAKECEEALTATRAALAKAE